MTATIAPQVAVPSARDEPRTPNDDAARLRGLIKDVRVGAQDVQRSLAVIATAAGLSDATARAQEVATAFKETASVFESTDALITRALKSAREVLERDDGVYDQVGDVVTSIEVSWRHATAAWAPLLPALAAGGQPNDPNAVARTGVRIQELLRSVVYNAGFLTIPHRLARHLRYVPVGEALIFASEFGDELPLQEDRDRILRYRASHPEGVDGIVDAEKGVVYRASTNATRRRLSYLFIGLTVLLGAVLVYVGANVGNWLALTDWPIKSDRTSELLIGYALVVLGALAHLVIHSRKQGIEGGKPFTSLDQWGRWMHVQELSILTGIVTLWIGFAWLVSSTPRIEWLSAIAVGYSVDSVADVALQRFDSKATDAIKRLTPA